MSKFITVATFTYPQEAYVIKSRLEAEGIPVFLKNELTIQTDNFLSNAMGGVQLQIMESDLESSLPLLEEAGLITDNEAKATKEHLQKKTTDPAQSICPNCGSDNISINKKPNSWWAAFLLLIGIPGPFYKKELHCFDCHQDFELDKEK